MVVGSRARTARLLFPLLCIVARSGLAQPLPPETSTITIPIRTDLRPIAAEIEKRVQSHFAGKTTERGIDIRYDVARDPIRLRMIGAGLHSYSTIKYAMEACRGRFPCVSCGFGQSRRIADVTLHSGFAWDPAWRLRSTTRLLPVTYAKPCEVTWLGIDITKRFIAPVVEQQLGDAAKIIDRNVPALTSIRPQAEQIWSALQAPYELAPRTWLVMEPADIALSPIAGSGPTVTTMLSLRAITRVVVGEKPAPTRKPLPPLKSVPATGPAFVRVPFDLELPYDEASRLATRDYANRTYQVEGRPLTLSSIRIAPAPNNRVLIEAMIDYRGGRLRNYSGLVYLEGTPRFDAATQTIVVPDLDYSLDPKRRGLFARILERAAHESIRSRLRDSARFPLGPRVAEARAELTRALTRPLGTGVHLHGRADAVEPQSVTPRADGIAVRVVARGVAEITIR